MTTTEQHLRHTFGTFAALEPNPRAYLASLIPHNFEHVRRMVARKGRGWRKEARASLLAVRTARLMLNEYPQGQN